MIREPGRMYDETAEVLDTSKHPLVLNIDNHIWPEFHQRTTSIALDTYHPNPDKIRTKIFKQGDRLVLPKQVQFLLAIKKYDAVLFAGAAGPGKSTILRWGLIRLLAEWAIPKEQGGLGVRDAEVGLFCNTYKELEDRHINKLQLIDKEIGQLVGGRNNPHFQLSEEYGSSKILLRNLDDPTKYSSTEFSAIAIDELTLTPESTFDFLMSRRRPNVRGIEHCPVLLASNPGGIGHSWVFRRFVNAETRDKPRFEEDLDYWTKGHYFIPALPKDNPFLTKQYLATLRGLPEKRRKALNEGDWSVFAGQYYNLDPNVHWIAPFTIPQHWNRIRVIDHGGNHPSVCLWMAAAPDGKVYIYRELSMAKIPAQEFKKLIHAMSVDEDGRPESYRLTVGDPSMKGSGKWSSDGTTPWTIYNNPMDGIGSFYMVEGNRDRVPGWQALSNAFSFELKDGKDVYGFDENGNPKVEFVREPKLFVFRNCVNTWNSLTTVIFDEQKNVDDVKKTKGSYGPGEGDDESDCVRMGYVMITPGAIDTARKTAERRKPQDLPPFPSAKSAKELRRQQYPFAQF